MGRYRMPPIKGKPKEAYNIKNYVNERIKYFWERKTNYELAKRSYDDDKYEFDSDMDKYFDVCATDDKITVDVAQTVKGIKKVICQKITQIKVTFDTARLKRLLGKELSKNVIKKKYTVKNWTGLMQLIKSLGVSYSDFTALVDVEEFVDEVELDRIVELGHVDIDKVKKCAKPNVKTQYYRILEKK